MLINSEPIRLVIGPEPIINVPIYMNESSLSMSSVLSPFSNILCPVWPGLLTKSIPEASLPLTLVYCPSFKFVGGPLFPLLIWVIESFCHCFSRFLLCEVLWTTNLLASQHWYVPSSNSPSDKRLDFDDLLHIRFKSFFIILRFSFQAKGWTITKGNSSITPTGIVFVRVLLVVLFILNEVVLTSSMFAHTSLTT